MKKHTIVVVAVVWMLVVVMGATSAVTMSLMGAWGGGESAPIVDGLVRVTEAEYDRIARYARLDEVRQTLATDYYKDLDDDQLVLGAIRGMLASTDDPYTCYYTPEENLDEAKKSQGVFEGVGLVLASDKNGYLTVLRIYPSSPALDSGIQTGDRILKINGEDVSAESDRQRDEAIGKIRDSVDPEIEMTVRRGDKTITVSMTKATLNMQRVSSRMLDGGIGYIAIYEFLGDDVVGFERELKKLRDQGMKALILDIRSNPGGFLNDVVAIADILLPKGLIVYTQDRNGQQDSRYSNKASLGLPLCVLVNGMSASASEILAGAVQDYEVGTIVGTTTFGKGIVQSQITFRTDGAGIKLTTASYFTPKGRSIHGEGIVPDVVVELPEDADLTDMDLNPEHDPQLMKAVSILEQKLRK